MEPPTTSQKAIGHDESPGHTWRVSRLERLGVPGRWPRSTPTASTGIRTPSWCGAAAPQGSPSGLSADIGREDPSDDRPRDLA
jgi:hypothetical protein